MKKLLQISEPGQEFVKEQSNSKDIVLGVDLGTTHCLCAYADDNGNINFVPLDKGSFLLSSIVAFASSGKALVGSSANAIPNAIKSTKRLMGKGLTEVDQNHASGRYTIVDQDKSSSAYNIVQIKTAAQNGDEITTSPIEIASILLEDIRQKAQSHLGKAVKDVVITTPAYFDDGARSSTRLAATKAGFNVLRLINEPTAAFVACGLDERVQEELNQGDMYGVYDLGGGTFDVSILTIKAGVTKVIATCGDTALGGDDFDRVIVDYFKAQIKEDIKDDLLLDIATQAKITLSNKEEFTNEQYNLKISRGEFEGLILPLVNKTVDILHQALIDVGITIEQLRAIILVGGSTRVPLISKVLQGLLTKEQKLYNHLDPDKVVAYGAAIQGKYLSTGGGGNLLLDVNPLSLGIETYGGLVEKIIERNHPLPARKCQEFTTFADGQNAMSIHVVQGEREIADDCRSLAKFELKGIPAMKAGQAKIAITFIVDSNGLLTVEAIEKATGVRQEVEVKPTYGLSIEQIGHELKEAFALGQEDMDKRLLVDAKINVERLIKGLEQALNVDAFLLDENELQLVEQGVEKLKSLSKSQDRDLLVSACQSVEEDVKFFSQRRVDYHIGRALKGRSVSNVEDELLRKG